MKVLVIDDDQGLRKSLTLILEEGGHDVLLAANGKEGLAIAANENPPDYPLRRTYAPDGRPGVPREAS